MLVIVIEYLYPWTKHAPFAYCHTLLSADHAKSVKITVFPDRQFPESMDLEVAERCEIAVASYLKPPLAKGFQ
jgi:hypothetical protein